MLNHYFMLCKSALFTKEHYVLAYYKEKCISLCSLKHPWKSIGALLLFCCGGVQHETQSRADQSEALKPEPCQPIRSSKTWATFSAVTPSYNKPPITSYFSDWISVLIHTHRFQLSKRPKFHNFVLHVWAVCCLDSSQWTSRPTLLTRAIIHS